MSASQSKLKEDARRRYREFNRIYDSCRDEHRAQREWMRFLEREKEISRVTDSGANFIAMLEEDVADLQRLGKELRVLVKGMRR